MLRSPKIVSNEDLVILQAHYCQSAIAESLSRRRSMNVFLLGARPIHHTDLIFPAIG